MFRSSKYLLFVAVLLATSCASPKVQIDCYDALCELSFELNEGESAEIWRKTSGGEQQYIATVTKGRYLDHQGCFTTEPTTIYYNIVTPSNSYSARATLQPSSDEALLDVVERFTVRYFSEFAHPVYGLARERSNNAVDMLTTGGTGFGVMALVAGMERGFLSAEQGFAIIEKIVGFLESAERFHGAWAHWYNAADCRPFNFSRYDDGGDLVETAFLIEGLLTARQYYTGGNEAQRKLCDRITALWEGVEWDWYTRGENDALYWHWSKNYGWKMNHRIVGFDETMITYILAASSPTHPIAPEVYRNSYKRSTYYKNGKEYYGIPLSLGMEYGGPLFFTHYSFLGLDPRNLCDEGVNLFERNRAHALIQYRYAVDNPKHWVGYGADCWGFTSSDDPLRGYTSHQLGTDDENGTVSPTAAIASIVYTPEQSLAALRNFYYNLGPRLFSRYGFYDAFNLSVESDKQVVPNYLAIDQGPIAVMIENYRSGLLWQLFMSNPEIGEGLRKLGFNYE